MVKMLAASGASPCARAQGVGSASWVPQVLDTEARVIAQRLAPFPAAYSGAMSLSAAGDRAISDTYGIYGAAALYAAKRVRLSGYLDVEMARGRGISRASGLAGVTYGEVRRQATADLGSGPYVARVSLRYTVAQANDVDTVASASDHMSGALARRRVDITAGKLAASDLFDLTRHANSTRTQFLNRGLFQNTAWDFAADARGYTNGGALSRIAPVGAVRVGSFQMPRRANGNEFDSDLCRARGDNVEVTLNVVPAAGVVRVLGYVNDARMGDYRAALAAGRAVRASPDIVADDAPGRSKRGVGMNIEQPISEGGETGAFVRRGWNDAATESCTFTEAEGHLSGGVQLAGSRWHRAQDRLGIAALRHTLGSTHRECLAAGGAGFLLGDGALRYGPQTFLESDYRMQLGAIQSLSPDVQYVRKPGIQL